MNDQETYIEQSVTYSVEIDGRVVVIEHVPARVSVETGERLFSPSTVERLQQIVRGQATPIKTVQVPVYDFAS